MSDDRHGPQDVSPPAPASTQPEEASTAEETVPEPAEKPREHGGPRGLEPTRYGDWEKNGRCYDF